MQEFAFIDYIKQSQQNINSPFVKLGIGDDAAVLDIPNHKELIISTDTLVDQVHFDQDIPIHDLGYKCLAVNLSDIAAMGAQPIAVTLNISAIELTKTWCKSFLNGFNQLAEKFNVALIGGDTTNGPLTISITAYGIVDKGQAIKRSGAKAGDKIFVSGKLGEAAYCLANKNNADIDMAALYRPKPQIELALKLQGVANAMIDISDGLSSDLNHMIKASQVGAIITADQIPLGYQLQKFDEPINKLDYALHGGEDYQLCFTIAEEKLLLIESLKANFPELTEIGIITKEKAYLLKQNNQLTPMEAKGYQHLKE